MSTRKTLYILILIAYSLSLVHSVVPHHHHKTTAEAASHEHSDHHHHDTDKHRHHGHDGNDSDSAQESSDETGHFFFFNHDINADVFVEHASIDNPVKTKKHQTPVAVKEQIVSFAVSRHLVYHPPQDDPNLSSATLYSIALRGPPSC